MDGAGEWMIGCGSDEMYGQLAQDMSSCIVGGGVCERYLVCNTMDSAGTGSGAPHWFAVAWSIRAPQYDPGRGQ